VDIIAGEWVGYQCMDISGIEWINAKLRAFAAFVDMPKRYEAGLPEYLDNKSIYNLNSYAHLCMH